MNYRYEVFFKDMSANCLHGSEICLKFDTFSPPSLDYVVLRAKQQLCEKLGFELVDLYFYSIKSI